MNRLRHFQIVEIYPSAAIRARVVGLLNRQIALQPADAVDALWLAPETPDVLMLFTDEANQRVGFKGTLYYRGSLDELGFVVTDEFCKPRERASRIRMTAPLQLRPQGADGKPAGAPIAHQTADFGADGALLEDGLPFFAGTIVDVELALPQDESLVSATAIIEEDAEGKLELRWITIAADDRARLHRHVVTELRQEAKRRHARRTESYVW